MADSAPLPAILIFAGFTLLLFFVAGREWLRLVRIYRRRPTPIAELPDSGQVTVAGVARRLDDVVEGAFTGTECLATTWRVTAFRTVRSLDGSVRTQGYQVADGHDGVPFVVEDDTGGVLVDPAAARLSLAEDVVEDPIWDPTTREGPQYPTTSLPWSEARSRSYFEGRLDEGERVYVEGRVRRADGADASDRSPEGALAAGRVAHSIGGTGTYLADSDRKSVARRALRTAVLGTLGGLLGLTLLLVFTSVLVV